MTLKQYRAFVYSVEKGSISNAAKYLDSSQTALTHLILDLEKELGFSLMKRDKGGIELSDSGKLVYSYMKRVVDEDDELGYLVKEIKEKKKKVINIATFSSVGVKWLPKIINGFRENHSDVEIKIFSGGYNDIIKSINEGYSDIGFITLPSPQNFEIYPLFKDRILAVVPNNEKYAMYDRIPIGLFEKEDVISLSESTDLDSRRIFEEGNIKPNIRYRTLDDYAMISMVENGLGICLEPELILNGGMDGIRTLELDPPAYRTICLAHSKMKELNDSTKELIEYILEWSKKLNG